MVLLILVIGVGGAPWSRRGTILRVRIDLVALNCSLFVCHLSVGWFIVDPSLEILQPGLSID